MKLITFGLDGFLINIIKNMNYKTLHDIRETNKLSLETYSQYIDFHLFDDTVDDIIKKNNEIIKKHEEISSEADSKEKFENFETIFTVSE